MATINANFQKLAQNYLFAEVAQRIAAYTQAYPQRRVIRLGIGDVTQALPPVCVAALQAAAAQTGTQAGIRGYGPYEGYEFLREAIVQGDYAPLGVALLPDEIFVSDGCKSDMSNMLDLFAPDNRIGITDPVYPAYVDANVIQNGGLGIQYIPCGAADGFIPQPPTGQPLDIIYLCSPNNPTGVAMTTQQLAAWVRYARENDAVILYDGAYESYITQSELPRSIYQIPGAREVAIEFRSYSKAAGFTGLRCGYSVVPHALRRGGASLNRLFMRRQSARYNGAPYIVQRAAQALYTPDGRAQMQASINAYMANAATIREGLRGAGYTVFGGVNAPYVWLQTPGNIDSWAFFDQLLHTCAVAGTPGVGFGACGQGYLRLTGFGTAEDTQRAVRRMVTQL